MDTLPASVDKSIPPTDTSQKSNTPAGSYSSASMVPRLVSVVEIIKREYLKILETKHSTRFLGLHQYNEIGTLEDLGLVVASTSQTADGKELESARDIERSRNIIETMSTSKHLLVLFFSPFFFLSVSSDR